LLENLNMPRSSFIIAVRGVLYLALACGDAVESEALGDRPPETIEECRELGGSPLFDPEDGRSVEESCPEGLRFLGEFSEPFFGSDGGICCTGPELESS
jgi:hypothetical protein